jgi:hypothetical protein
VPPAVIKRRGGDRCQHRPPAGTTGQHAQPDDGRQCGDAGQPASAP